MIEIQYASKSDVSSWMDLVRLVKSNFPGLETEESLLDYQKTLLKNINCRSAICAKSQNKVVGVLLFSTEHNMLSCMAVHPEYRRQGIATKMMKEMLTKLDRSNDICVTTFRECDEKGRAPRALYQKFGFVEDELVEEFGYPNQKFILHPLQKTQ